MEMYVWWEVPISMRVEWRCASMINGEQFVMMAGAVLMLLWSACSLVMQEVSASIFHCKSVKVPAALPLVQVELHIAMLGLEQVLDLSIWMMSNAAQALANCWSAIAGQS